MKILFLDQSGQLGGAELSLTDVAKFYQKNCVVCLFADGRFRQLLEQKQIPVEIVATSPIKVSKDSSLLESLGSITVITPLIARVAKLARNYDLIYANTQKALVVGALASFFSRRPLIYHLRDILSGDHFSRTNRGLTVTLANHFASVVIANSQATEKAFIEAGGRKEITTVVYNGFDPNKYQCSEHEIHQTRQQLGLEEVFVVGHFSRLSPWKGQHLLLEALVHCPSDVTAIFVGDCLFGEQDYAEHLYQLVKELKLEARVKFLGFESEVVPLMHACDLIAHTSTAPEPFGRVIIEAMLCQIPVVAAAAGGVVELIENGKTGWLFSPENSQQLAEVICYIKAYPEKVKKIANQSQIKAMQNFNLDSINQQISQILSAAYDKLPGS